MSDAVERLRKLRDEAQAELDKLGADEREAPAAEPDYTQMDVTQRRHALADSFARKGQQARANRAQADREQNDRAYQSRMAAGTQTGGEQQ